VKTLVVGVIEGQEKVVDHKFKITKKTAVNDATATFTFTSVGSDLSGTGPKNLKRWYNDPTMIGRHFLVYGA
jgi:hypothetical protein